MDSNRVGSVGVIGVLIEILIEGLLTNHRSLNSRCKSALLAFGGGIAPFLRAIASDPKIDAVHRRRLQKVEKLLASPEEASTIVASLEYALLGALRVTNERLNKRAIAAFAILPWCPIDSLIAEAVKNHRKASSYSVRLLQAAAACDKIPDVIQRLGLIGLMYANDYSIQRLAVALVWKFRSQELSQ